MKLKSERDGDFAVVITAVLIVNVVCIFLHVRYPRQWVYRRRVGGIHCLWLCISIQVSVSCW